MTDTKQKIIVGILGVFILLIGISIGVMCKSKNIVDNVNATAPAEIVNTTEDTTGTQNPAAPTSQVKKPTITTLSYTYSGYGCGLPVAGAAPCTDTPPAKVIVNGIFKANGAYVVSWFEYWTVDSNGIKGAIQSTPRKTQNTAEGNISEIIYGITAGTTYNYRLVGESDAGKTYGEAKILTIDIASS